MADEIDKERFPQANCQTFMCQKITNVEEIARVLPIQGGDQFAGVEVFKRNDGRLGIAELVFDMNSP